MQICPIFAGSVTYTQCSKTLIGIKIVHTGMICVVQHNTKTCVICIGVAWIALPAAIVCNYHLTLIAPSFTLNESLLQLYIEYTEHVCKT